MTRQVDAELTFEFPQTLQHRRAAVSSYEGKHVTFETPPEWRDCSVVAFSAPFPQGSVSPNVAMTREPSFGKTLRTLAHDHVAQLAKHTPKIEVLESLDTRVDGREAIRVRVGWTSVLGPVEQIVVLVDGAEDPEEKVTVFAITMLAEQAGHAVPAFEGIIASVHFGKEARTAAPRIADDRHVESCARLAAVPMPGTSRRRAP